MSPRRDRKSVTTTREKWPEKAAFLLTSCQLRVSEQDVALETLIEPKLPVAISQIQAALEGLLKSKRWATPKRYWPLATQ